jgi:hypothetical protein
MSVKPVRRIYRAALSGRWMTGQIAFCYNGVFLARTTLGTALLNVLAPVRRAI